MKLPQRELGRDDVYMRVKQIVSSFNQPEDSVAAVYVLECRKPEDKEDALNTYRELVGEDYFEYLRNRRNKLSSMNMGRPSSFEDALKDNDIDNSNSLGSGIDSHWIDIAYEVDNILYVGWSNRVNHRIAEHVKGSREGAFFTHVFPPTKVRRIDWYNSKEEALAAEEKTAEDLSDISIKDNIEGKRAILNKKQESMVSLWEELNELEEISGIEDDWETFAYFK